jgi:superfamily II DNA or RNA helicase
MLLRPTDPTTEIIARPQLDGAMISARLPERDEHFIKAVRACHLRWDGGAWRRTIGELAGDPADRMVELCVHILAAGFSIQIGDEIGARIADQDYAPEQRRWIVTGKGAYEGWLRIWWGYGEPDFYRRAQFLSGSTYDPGTKCVVVPIESFAEVVDFAEMHGFEVHPKAQDLIDAQRLRVQSAVVVDVEIDEPETPAWRRPRLSTEPVVVPDDLRDVVPPPAFTTTTEMLPHQTPAVAHIERMRVGGLFMDMGTGKTRCAIELVHKRQRRISRVIWFCPVSLKTTAVHEIIKHTDCAPEQIYAFDDDTTTRTLPRATWYIVGLESISSSDRVTLAANAIIDEHAMVIVDESSYIKGHASKRTRRITQMASRARYRLILTGTPLSQGVEDLFAQMAFLDERALGYGSFYSFAANHLEYHPDYPGLVVRAHNTQHLAAKVAPYIYQITKDEAGLDLPKKLYENRYFDFTPDQTYWYHRAKEEILLNQPDDETDSYVIFQLFGALQQVASGFWNGTPFVSFEHRRLLTLQTILDGIDEDEPVIIWCKYRYSVDAISKALGNAVALYHGDLSETDRDAELARWRAGDARYLVATMATGAHGLTLTEARYAVFYESSFKYSERLQAEDRIHRIGQDRRPTYISIYACCGIEERIELALNRKENLARAFRRDVVRAKDRAAKTRQLVENL